MRPGDSTCGCRCLNRTITKRSKTCRSNRPRRTPKGAIRNTTILSFCFSPQAESGFDATVHFVATRREHKVALVAASTKVVALNTASAPDLQRYLEPDKMVPLNGVISDLAAQQTAGLTTPLAKARHIYDYVIATMRYDKSGEGWGRGDVVWACTSKRGNCTDFHSLFIGKMDSRAVRNWLSLAGPQNRRRHSGLSLLGGVLPEWNRLGARRRF
jgi:hypothetical protein